MSHKDQLNKQWHLYSIQPKSLLQETPSISRRNPKKHTLPANETKQNQLHTHQVLKLEQTNYRKTDAEQPQFPTLTHYIIIQQ